MTAGDAEKTLRQAKIFLSHARTPNDHIERLQEILRFYPRVIAVREEESRVQLFKLAVLDYIQLYSFVRRLGEFDSPRHQEQFSRISKQLVESLGSQRAKALEELGFARFREQVEATHGNSALLGAIKASKDPTLNALHLRLKASALDFDEFLGFFLGHLESQSKKDPSPHFRLGMEIFDLDEDFDDDEFFHQSEKLKREAEKGKSNFVFYLLEEFNVKINGREVVGLTPEEAEFQAPSVAQFFQTARFPDQLTTELAKLVLKIFDERQWTEPSTSF